MRDNRRVEAFFAAFGHNNERPGPEALDEAANGIARQHLTVHDPGAVSAAHARVPSAILMQQPRLNERLDRCLMLGLDDARPAEATVSRITPPLGLCSGFVRGALDGGEVAEQLGGGVGVVTHARSIPATRREGRE